MSSEILPPTTQKSVYLTPRKEVIAAESTLCYLSDDPNLDETLCLGSTATANMDITQCYALSNDQDDLRALAFASLHKASIMSAKCEHSSNQCKPASKPFDVFAQTIAKANLRLGSEFM